MKEFGLMICFARSGGTLLNRCLAALDDVVIMSEVSPVITKDSVIIKDQAKKWYDIDIHSADFSNAFLELKEFCEKENKNLIIRDWSFNCFVPNIKNDFNPPSKLLVLDELKGMGVKPFAFIRDGIDVWISRGMPDADIFFEEYLQYIKEVLKSGIKIVKYEDFCANSDKSMQDLCKHLGIVYSDKYKNYNRIFNVSGDLQIEGGSRGVKQNKIVLLPRKRISKAKIREIDNCKKMREANQLLGYSIMYKNRELESLSSFLYKTGVRKIKGGLNLLKPNVK